MSKVMAMGEKECFRLGAQGRQYLKYFGVKGRYGLGLKWLTFNGGDPMRGANSWVGLTSSHKFDTRGIEVRIMSWESLL